MAGVGIDGSPCKFVCVCVCATQALWAPPTLNNGLQPAGERLRAADPTVYFKKPVVVDGRLWARSRRREVTLVLVEGWDVPVGDILGSPWIVIV